MTEPLPPIGTHSLIDGIHAADCWCNPDKAQLHDASFSVLLAGATSLPWKSWEVTGRGGGVRIDLQDKSNAALIVYAVNRLPDYEAAVDALERIVELGRDDGSAPSDAWELAWDAGCEALRRLRGES